MNVSIDTTVKLEIEGQTYTLTIQQLRTLRDQIDSAIRELECPERQPPIWPYTAHPKDFWLPWSESPTVTWCSTSSPKA